MKNRPASVSLGSRSLTRSTAKCAKCGVVGKPTFVYRGSGLLEVLFWLICTIPLLLMLIDPLPCYWFWISFALVAPAYSAWRWKSRYRVCRECDCPIDADWKATNKAAVAGFVFGLMPQLPLVSGLLALILGGIARKKANTDYEEGRILSKLALILGGINVVGWLIFSISLSLSWGTVAPPSDVLPPIVPPAAPSDDTDTMPFMPLPAPSSSYESSGE